MILKKSLVAGSNLGVSQEASKHVTSQPRTQTTLSSLCKSQFQGAFTNTLHPALIGPWGRLELKTLGNGLSPKTVDLWGMNTHRPRPETFQLHGGEAGWKFPGSPVDPSLSARHPTRSLPPALSSQVGSKATCAAAGLLTWAMPAPISPPPMTATCLTTIFFAEAEAVDVEDTVRTNCLVTKAMVQRWRRRRPRRQLRDPAK